jgi:MinD superfamily P-loop ATPase
MNRKVAGKWFVSSTDKGTLVHARLNIAEDNSGKLVTEVKKEARRLAGEEGRSLVIVDGPPGVGCPVISSLSGAGMVLVVTEPSVSGIHDLKRVLELARHFHVKPAVLINKYDINEEKTAEIEQFCRSEEVPVLGRIGFDPDFTRSQVEAVPLVEYSDGEAAGQIRKVWEEIRDRLEV